MSDFWKSLRTTVVESYSIDDLDMVLAEDLSKNLRSTVPVGPLNLVVFHLLRIARNEGWLVRLLKALRDRRPENQEFQAEIDRSIQALETAGAQLDEDMEREQAPTRAFSDVVMRYRQFLLGLGTATAVAAIAFLAWDFVGSAERSLSIKTFSAENNVPIPSVTFQYYRPNDPNPTQASGKGTTWMIPLNDVEQNTQIELAPNLANLTPEQLANRVRLAFEIKKIHFGDPRTITLYIKLNSSPKGGP